MNVQNIFNTLTKATPLIIYPSNKINFAPKLNKNKECSRVPPENDQWI